MSKTALLVLTLSFARDESEQLRSLLLKPAGPSLVASPSPYLSAAAAELSDAATLRDAPACTRRSRARKQPAIPATGIDAHS